MMGTHNESEGRKLKPGERLTKQHFSFLVDEYGFKYERYSFRSKRILIQVQVGHITPRVIFNKIGEPDPRLFYLELDWIIAYFHGAFPGTTHDYLKHSLEENMLFASKMLRENADRLINEFDTWWIPAHVFVYRWMENNARQEGRLERFQRTDKYYYDYLKSKGAI